MLYGYSLGNWPVPGYIPLQLIPDPVRLPSVYMVGSVQTPDVGNQEVAFRARALHLAGRPQQTRGNRWPAAAQQAQHRKAPACCTH